MTPTESQEYEQGLLRTLLTDLQREPFLPHVGDVPDPNNLTLYRTIDWGIVEHAFFYRRRRAGSFDNDEPGVHWGSILPLQLVLGLGVEEPTPHFLNQCAAFHQYLFNPPYSSDRGVWTDYGLMPPEYERRLTALRRRLYLSMARDPTLLRRLVQRLERRLGSAVTSPSSEENGYVTTIDVYELAANAQLPEPVQRVSEPYRLKNFDTEKELALMLGGERLGCVSDFGKDSPLHHNYLLVRLSSYVKEIWDLQESVPALDYAMMSVGGVIPYPQLQEGIVAVREWLKRELVPAGARATLRVFTALGVPQEDDLFVVTRKRPPQRYTAQTPNLYTVKTPKGITVHGLPAEVRVHRSQGRFYFVPEDFNLDFAKIRNDTTYNAPHQLRNFRRYVKLRNKVRYLEAGFLAAFIKLPAIRSWFDTLYYEGAPPKPRGVDPAVAYVKAKAATARKENKRVRCALPFTPEEDRYLRERVSPRTSSAEWEALYALWPHHSLRRIQARAGLILALVRRKLPIPEPLTAEYLIANLPARVIKRYARAQ